MTVLQEYDAFNTTIVSKQEIENEKISTHYSSRFNQW